MIPATVGGATDLSERKMVAVNIRIDFGDVRRRLEEIPENVGKQAMARTLNEVVAKANTRAQREIASEFTLRRDKIRERIRIRRANRSSLIAELFVSEKSRALHLTDFQAKDTRRTGSGKRRTGKGVQVRVRKGGTQRLLKRAFIAKGKTSGKAIVFERTGDARYPIKAIFAVGVGQMFNTKRIQKRVLEQIQRDAPVIFERNARFYLARFNAR